MNNNIQKLSTVIKVITLTVGLNITTYSFAESIVVEGTVSNEASKQAILLKMKSIYENDQVIDKIQVKTVRTPDGWENAVTQVINPNLKKVSQGKLIVQGTKIELNGKVANDADKQATETLFKSTIPKDYVLNTNLSINMSEQKILDDTLKNRIIEFESGSAILTATGQKILNEMAVALSKVNDKNIKVIGHTDSSGDSKKNIQLSLERAEAVKKYLVSKQISESILSTEGVGSQRAVADNSTAEGRKKNRRIEFEVI